MITFIILNHENYHYNPDYHYTIALYPDIEKYDNIKFILELFIEELCSLKKDGLEIAGILWKFELYFSSDWKFLIICLGLNSANSRFFCPWCLCSKDQIGDLNKTWNIEKDIDEISINYNNINGHIFPPIFNMIPIGNVVFDELHVFLQITDRLWELVLSEIKERDSHNWEYITGQKFIKPTPIGYQIGVGFINFRPVANSRFFCPWCLCSKDQIGDLNKTWNIEKDIDEISINYNNINGHIFPPIFNMIPIGNVVFDELHVFLQITDRLWELVLSEIKERGLFNNLTRKIILDEMKRLKISF
ncbi:hypothetical protein Glove_606g16 [Diversispora epigaea]|uniref:Uncharacterized protein n=1 Tax=Diversispora epigaea TaxID=1348612 RepID=A0A397GBP5_9GLOM|nr:hypothetical protein Glove_606g16 [Diversispora epigaea]